MQGKGLTTITNNKIEQLQQCTVIKVMWICLHSRSLSLKIAYCTNLMPFSF